MAHDRSRDKLLDFLDYLSEKGLVAKSTIAGRKAAVGKVLGILSPEEADDVTKLDLGQVMTRFQNLEGRNYTPGSLNTYLSRLNSAVADFDTYLKNPLGFRPTVQSREKRTKPESKRENASSPSTSPAPSQDRVAQKSPLMPSSSILPIPIRQDVTVYVQGIPYDLTAAEATKIANVIRAMGVPAQ